MANTMLISDKGGATVTHLLTSKQLVLTTTSPPPGAA
jgi:hypothetical protein